MHTMYKCKFHCTVSKRTLYEHEHFMNIVETITKNMKNHVSCLKMSFENTKSFNDFRFSMKSLSIFKGHF